MKKYPIIIFWAFCSCLTSFAQDILFSSDYLQNSFLYNPARAGNNGFYSTKEFQEQGNIYVSHRNQWLSSSDPSGSQSLSIDAPVSKKIGLGGILFNERAHIFTRTGIAIAYAYHIKEKSISPKHVGSLGISASFLNQRINIDYSKIKHPSDNSLSNNQWDGNYFNLGFGAAYRWEKGISIDFSIGNLMDVAWAKNKTAYQNALGFRPYYFMSFRWLKNLEKVGIEPYIAAYIQPSLPWQVSLGLSNTFFITKETNLILGLGSSFQNKPNLLDDRYTALNTFAGIRFLSDFSITGFWDFTTNFKESGNTVGIQAGYRFGNGLTPKKIEKNKTEESEKDLN